MSFIRKPRSPDSIQLQQHPADALPFEKTDECAHRAYPVITLTAPTRVSPTTATEQKQHQQNNQYG
jgi:hypothetical protein